MKINTFRKQKPAQAPSQSQPKNRHLARRQRKDILRVARLLHFVAFVSYLYAPPPTGRFERAPRPRSFISEKGYLFHFESRFTRSVLVFGLFEIWLVTKSNIVKMQQHRVAGMVVVCQYGFLVQ